MSHSATSLVSTLENSRAAITHRWVNSTIFDSGRRAMPAVRPNANFEYGHAMPGAPSAGFIIFPWGPSRRYRRGYETYHAVSGPLGCLMGQTDPIGKLESWELVDTILERQPEPWPRGWNELRHISVSLLEISDGSVTMTGSFAHNDARREVTSSDASSTSEGVEHR